MPNTIKISQEGRVVLVTINRPEALNALNIEVMQEMIKVLTPLIKVNMLVVLLLQVQIKLSLQVLILKI